MIKSARQNPVYLMSSVNQSKISSSQNSKKYRCECCKDKQYHDYNRQKRLRRESTSSKRTLNRCQSSSQSNLKENSLVSQNTNHVSKIDDYQVKQKQSLKKLPSIIQSPPMTQQQPKRDNLSSKKVDMKSYCKSLFSPEKKEEHGYFIEVKLEGKTYRLAFESSERMKLAIGEVKLLIQRMQK